MITIDPTLAQETQPTVEAVLEKATPFLDALSLPHPETDPEGFEAMMEQVYNRNQDVRIDKNKLPDSDELLTHEALIQESAEAFYMCKFRTEWDPEDAPAQQDFETRLQTSHKFVIVPAGREGIIHRFAPVLSSVGEGLSPQAVVLAGSKEYVFRPKKDGSENNELRYFRETYPDAYRSLIEKNGNEYIPTQYDLVEAQAVALREENPNLTIETVGVNRYEGEKGVHTHTIVNGALQLIADRYYGGDIVQMKNEDVAMITNEVYLWSTGLEAIDAAEEYGANMYVAGLPLKNPDRKLQYYFDEVLKSIHNAIKLKAGRERRALVES
jgi:hypothetical protein